MHCHGCFIFNFISESIPLIIYHIIFQVRGGFRFAFVFSHSLQNSHIFTHTVETQESLTDRRAGLETGRQVHTFCLTALPLLFSVKGRERKGSCTNKFSSIHRLHLVRQGLLLCVARRHSASQLPHIHAHTLIYIQREY